MTKFKKIKDLILLEEEYGIKIDHINNLMKAYIEEEDGSPQSNMLIMWHPTIPFNVYPPQFLVHMDDENKENPRVMGMNVAFSESLDNQGISTMLDIPNGIMLKSLTIMRRELKRKQKELQQSIVNEKSPTS